VAVTKQSKQKKIFSMQKTTLLLSIAMGAVLAFAAAAGNPKEVQNLRMPGLPANRIVPSSHPGTGLCL
jgi:hypothetical protein